MNSEKTSAFGSFSFSSQPQIVFQQSKTCVVESITRVKSCKVEWVIEGFFTLPSSHLNSECFTFCNVPCRMCMLSHSNMKPNSVPVFLELMKSFTGTHRVDITLGIKKSDGSVFDCSHKILEFQKDALSNHAGFIDKNRILESKNIWTPDGNLTMVCYLSHCGDDPVTTLPTATLVNNLEDLFLNEREVDVTIKVKGVPFKVHRLILMARSTVFATMFQHDMVEKQSGEVDIDDCDPDSFRDFILHLYTGKTNHVTSKNALGLYSTADKYAVLELKRECASCMSLNLSIDSICDTLVVASFHNESELLRSATNFFIKNMKEVVQSPKWDEFQCKYSTLVKELFLKSADYIKI